MADSHEQGRHAPAEPAELQRCELQVEGRNQPTCIFAFFSALELLRQDDGEGVEAPAQSCSINRARVGPRGEKTR